MHWLRCTARRRRRRVVGFIRQVRNFFKERRTKKLPRATCRRRQLPSFSSADPVKTPCGYICIQQARSPSRRCRKDHSRVDVRDSFQIIFIDELVNLDGVQATWTVQRGPSSERRRQRRHLPSLHRRRSASPAARCPETYVRVLASSRDCGGLHRWKQVSLNNALQTRRGERANAVIC